MEQWEIDLRKTLEDDLPEGKYKMGESPDIKNFNKTGVIEWMVSQEKKKRILNDFYESHKKTDKSEDKYKEQFKNLMTNLKTKTDEHKNS